MDGGQLLDHSSYAHSITSKWIKILRKSIGRYGNVINETNEEHINKNYTKANFLKNKEKENKNWFYINFNL